MLVAQYSLRSPFAARIHIHIDVGEDSVVFFKPQASLNKSAWRVLEAFKLLSICGPKFMTSSKGLIFLDYLPQ